MDNNIFFQPSVGKHYQLKFKYVLAFGVESDIVLAPAFVRYYKQLWYVIGVKIDGKNSFVVFRSIAFVL